MLKNRIIYLFLVLSVGLILVGSWLSFVDIAELKAIVWEINPNYLVVATFFYLSAYFLRSIRWNILVRPVVKLSLYQSWIFSMGSNFTNYLIPLRIGELVKAWFVKKRFNIPMVKVLPSIFIDKSFDTLGIIIVLSILPFISIQLSKAVIILLSALVLVFIVSFFIILTAALQKELSVKFLSLITKVLPRKVGEKISYYISLFIAGMNVFEHHWSRLFFAFLLTAVGVILDGLYFFMVFKAFGVSIAFLIVIFGYTLINLSYALPQPPAQLGSNEWMMIIIFAVGFGLTVEGVSAIMATAHILTALLISIGGVAAFAYSGTNILKLVLKGEELYEQ